jgi:hypothetical protein
VAEIAFCCDIANLLSRPGDPVSSDLGRLRKRRADRFAISAAAVASDYSNLDVVPSQAVAVAFVGSLRPTRSNVSLLTGSISLRAKLAAGPSSAITAIA